jgi:sterol desaturase/sphingolipid hydroxylase (fatty acid hydroxylase superfamily)
METVIPILVPATFVLALVLERLFPARALPKVRGWLLRGIVCFVVTGMLNGIIPMLLTMAIAGRTPLHLGTLGTLAGALVGFLVSDFVSYWVHRSMHNIPFLWRWTHQMHHSAERLDIAGSAYFHPFDISLQIGASTAAAILLGITPDAAALAGYVSFLFGGMVPHLNVRTPQWLGWIFQRPEAHSVHHARGVHAYNYGNFMLWDILFGTFRNPATFNVEAGFWNGASSRVGAMLVGRDVSTPPAQTNRDAVQHEMSGAMS